MRIEILTSIWAQKQLRKIPDYIGMRLNTWISSVEEEGLEETRKIKGFHDEPLNGSRTGQRSIRLNKSYRAIYKETKGQGIIIIHILEVNKHDY
ncbi:MAG: type II toxin-antitoxin system mRNA interferase toxin, RelE/StbE family [Bacteriovoracaceae bacterium]|nr:type II toxin-antitoxin system mRNA interferase toxin, RelE/StbE family [Bacteriovoracaceae bacterium]